MELKLKEAQAGELRQLYKSLGPTDADQIAEAIGLSSASVQKYFRGDVHSTKTAEAIILEARAIITRRFNQING